MDTDNLINYAAPEIKSLEPFYTNLMVSRLLVIKDEFSDNEKEKKATEDVLDSIHAIIDIDPPQISLRYECNNETWLEIMNDGLPAPEVTGGMAKNPDNTEYQSKAAVVGVKFSEGAEAPTKAYDEAIEMAKSTLADDIRAIITNCQPIIDEIKNYVVQEIKSTLGGNAS